mmetsp:Transcript_11698/g.13528  ORF Transcript_11698/g.13528 Transcript_11698/m.13528 type:complete len:204 (-) Transcript_11698:135-746(-)
MGIVTHINQRQLFWWHCSISRILQFFRCRDIHPYLKAVIINTFGSPAPFSVIHSRTRAHPLHTRGFIRFSVPKRVTVSPYSTFQISKNIDAAMWMPIDRKTVRIFLGSFGFHRKVVTHEERIGVLFMYSTREGLINSTLISKRMGFLSGSMFNNIHESKTRTGAGEQHGVIHCIIILNFKSLSFFAAKSAPDENQGSSTTKAK